MRYISFLAFKGLIEKAINVQLQGMCSATTPAGQLTLMTAANHKLPSDHSWSYVTRMKTLETQAPTQKKKSVDTACASNYRFILKNKST